MVFLRGTCIVACLGVSTCATPREDQTVEAIYGRDTGKLNELAINAGKDGRPNVFSHMNGPRIVRIEIDNDEDGKIDRWEYYGYDQKLEKVGFSRGNDGKPDAWSYQASDGTIGKIEIATRRDGIPNRTEFYENGSRVRVEEDTDGDRRIDKWETYDREGLATVAFDLNKSGRPTHTIDYRSQKAEGAATRR